MRRQSSILSWVSLVFLLAALILFILQLVSFSRIRANFPSGLVIAGVPVGSLDRAQAAERLVGAYSIPVELRYDEEVIHLNPGVVGFELDMESMLAAGNLERTQQSFWQGFWDYLWRQQQISANVPLAASYSEARLRTYLMGEIAPRYDQPATSALPVVGTVNFIPGFPGTTLDVERAVLLIENAFHSITNRFVNLPLQRTEPSHLPFESIGIILKQTIDSSGFDGIAGVYLLDLQTAQEIHFVRLQGEDLSFPPDMAFTASSIIKIPIMVSVFRRVGENLDTETLKLLEDMIELSGNDPADRLMKQVLDSTLGPLIVTEDMQELGLENTFLAGHFYPGAPLLVRFDTPANQHPDADTNPDPYSQTTASDIGMLLADIYQCAQNNGGALVVVFASEITQKECRNMLTLLTRNHLGSLIEGGVPDGTQVAHKHGWVSNAAGYVNTIGDAGIVYTPGGSYVFVAYLYHPIQLIWGPASELIAQLSQAVYNFFNLSQP